MTAGMGDQARHWRTCAEGYDLVTDVAEQRGKVSPRLIELMRADADRYRRWAVLAEAEEQRRWLASRIDGWMERVARAGFYPF